MQRRRRPVRAAAVGLVACLVPALVACSGRDDPDPSLSGSPSATSASPTAAGTVTLGVYGREDELEAFEGVADDYNASSLTGQVELEPWRDRAAAVQGVADGDVPDVFMASRQDLPGLMSREAVRPVGELLDERGVDFGDDFSRDAVAAFGLDAQLQCMPYAVSPEVMFVNTELVDFERMAGRGLNVPQREDFWNLAEFTAAAEFASRPARGTRGTRGFYIEPTLHGLTPYIYSGGGQVYDDDDAPTSLALSDGDTQDALERSLAVLRDAQLTLTDKQLVKASPQDWFERGRLGMMAGSRDLVPRLRSLPGLAFDVWSMPVVDSPATVGGITGLCMSAETEDPQAAADVIAGLVSDEAMARVAAAGFMVPANNSVANSEVFLQPLREPRQAALFNNALRGMVVPPLIADRSELEEAVGPLVEQLLTLPGELDLEAVTEQIDEASRPVLDPDYVPESPSPSLSPSD